jgi:bifunctional non-homologous end joining protein LigD/DNA ligase-1
MIEPIAPMLAARGEPFDSPDYLFEVKWNGIRALAAHDSGRWQLWGRERTDYTARYPELDILGHLPPGTVVDGELVLLCGGRPDCDALLGRHQVLDPVTIRQSSQRRPVTYVLFDLLYERDRCLLGRPLRERRDRLRDLLGRRPDPRWVFSEGVVGPGRAWFEQAVRQGQEGAMAKHLASAYLPGRRTAAWRKLKPTQVLPTVIVGYLPGREGCHGLLVAADQPGGLRYAACLRAGFTDHSRALLGALLASRVQARPVVPCPHRAVWVRPELYCQVRFLEWTPAGHLRGASFQRLLSSAPSQRGRPVR